MLRRVSQWIVFGAAVAGFAAILFYTRHAIEVQANRSAPRKEVATQHPDVSVVTVEPGRYQSKITAYGGAAPHFELSLTAQVSGQADVLSNAFESGRRVKKGDLLASLDDTQYRAAVAAAEQNLSDAQLSLLEEQRQALRAEAEWNSSGIKGDPASDLVLRKPQLAAASAAVRAAKAALENARNDLANARIKAPFDALIVERFVTPGSFVQPGTAIATLYSTDRVEITVSLSAADWSCLLPEGSVPNSGKWSVELFQAQTGQQWSGYVLRSEQHLVKQSRQRRLILAVDRPFDLKEPLLAGTFVKAEISGRIHNDLWRLPNSAYSQKGEIWYVKPDNTLTSFAATPLFSDAEAIYIHPPQELAGTSQRVLIHPLNDYLNGMRVNPVEEKSHA